MINIDKVDYEKLRVFLNSQNLISVSDEWRKFVEAYQRADAHFLGIFENETLRAIIPAFKFKNTLEAVPKFYTEFFYPDKDDFIISPQLLKKLIAGIKKFDSIKLSLSFILDDRLLNEFRKTFQPALITHILKLSTKDTDFILNEVIEHKTRNQIRTAYQRGGFNLRLDGDMDKFFALYLRMVKRLRSIPKERSYFEALQSSFGNNFQTLSAFKDNKLVGANLVLVKNAYLHLMFNISDADFLKDYINNFLYWETILFGINREVNIFDFGPSTMTDKTHHHFKEGFGAKPAYIFKLNHYNSFRRHFYDFISTKLRNLNLRLNKYV